MTGSRRGKGTSRPSVMMRLSHIVRGERNNVNAIIVPTRLAIQPSSLNEGMRSIVSLPPRVFLQSDPEMLHFRVQEALNEANSHILMQRRYVAQEKALRMDAEKETTRLQTQLKSINSQLSNQALSISTVMEELLDLTDRARIDVETDQRYLPEIHQRLADEAARHASTVLDILRPVLDDAKLAEQRAEKSQKSFDEILIESTNGPLSFLPDERRDGKTGGSDRRVHSRRSRAMPAPELLLYGDGEVLETPSSRNEDNSVNEDNEKNEEKVSSLESSFEEEDENQRYYVPEQPKMSEAFLRETNAVREEFHRKQQAIAMRNGKNVKHELPRKNVAADLASAGELAWVKALENASLGPQGN